MAQRFTGTVGQLKDELVKTTPADSGGDVVVTIRSTVTDDDAISLLHRVIQRLTEGA